MALIKCSECGKEISDKSKTCIHCGCPIEKEYTCSECGQPIKINDKKCLNCGNPLKEKNTNSKYQKKWEELTANEINRIQAYRKKNKEWYAYGGRPFILIIFIIIILSLLISPSFIIGLGTLKISSRECILFFSTLVMTPLVIYSAFKEPKKWYENNVERLYEEKIVK